MSEYHLARKLEFPVSQIDFELRQDGWLLDLGEKTLALWSFHNENLIGGVVIPDVVVGVFNSESNHLKITFHNI